MAQVSLFCVGNVIKWIARMVNFYDCKERISEKKVIRKEENRMKQLINKQCLKKT